MRPASAEGQKGEEHPEAAARWEPGDPPEELDLLATLTTGGVILPGITTLRRESVTAAARGRGREAPWLVLALDASGSMPNPKRKRSYAVLAAFMAGLTLGSLLAGRLADRVRAPLAWFGAVEILIGLSALTTPPLLGALDDLYPAIYAWAGDRPAAMTALAMMARWTRGAAARLAATVPRSISRSPLNNAGTRAGESPRRRMKRAAGGASRSIIPTTVRIRTKTEKTTMNPPIMNSVATDSRTASPRSCPRGRPSSRRPRKSARTARRNIPPLGSSAPISEPRSPRRWKRKMKPTVKLER